MRGACGIHKDSVPAQLPRDAVVTAIPARPSALLIAGRPARRIPPCLLTVIIILMPIILKLLIKQKAITTESRVELIFQVYYFTFLFLQVFLVISASSSVATVLAGRTHNAKSLAMLITQSLPKTSNYFLSCILLQGLSVSAGSLLQFEQLIELMLARWLDKTPRQMWNRGRSWEVKWGTYFPMYTHIAVIGLVYWIVSPLIMLVSIVSFSLFLVVQRYVILSKIPQPHRGSSFSESGESPVPGSLCHAGLSYRSVLTDPRRGGTPGLHRPSDFDVTDIIRNGGLPLPPYYRLSTSLSKLPIDATRAQ